jgi:hypothetical protein
MTVQKINIGNLVNDGLGDDLRTAFQKVNANFTELQSSLTVTASNAAGTSGFGIFAQKVGSDLQFKNLLAGNKILMESFVDSIRISSTQPDAFTRIDLDHGSTAVRASQHEQITLQGGKNINVTSDDGQVIIVDTDLDLSTVLINYDFGPILGTFDNAIQLSFATANIDFGTVSSLGSISLDLGEI